MGLFGKKHAKSTLRFCQSVTELDTSHLFSEWDLTLAISRLTEWRHHAMKPADEACGYGLAHDIYGHGQPLLPVQVRFLFSPPHDDGDAGYGSVWKTDFSGQPYYQAEIIIYDPDRRVFQGFQRAFEHAAISGHSFAHLILRRQRQPSISDIRERDVARKAEQERNKDLMKQVEAGEADMPAIAFDRVAFEDNIFLKAPSWTHEWHDDLVDRPKYHSREAADWRNRPWRR